MTLDGPFLAFAAARWLGYLAAFFLVGIAVFGRIIRRESGDSSWPVTLVRRARLAAMLLAISFLARLYFQCRSLLEPEDPLSFDFVVAVLQSTWGRGWLAQAVAGIVALAAWRAIGKKPTGTRPAAAAAIAIVAAAPWTGHAVGLAQAPSYAPLLHLIHFGAAAAWLGSLASLAVLLKDPGRRPLALVEAFSPVALVAGVTAMVAGAILGIVYLGGIGQLERLLTTEYGQALAVKLIALALTAGLGGYNWRVMLPRLKAGQDAPIGLTATAELCVGAVILAVTAVLVSLPAPGELAE